MNTFTPSVNPSINGTSLSVAPRIIAAQFGDGYRQTAPDGLNPFVHTGTLAWSSILQTDANTIISFLQANLGVAFYYTHPFDNVQRKWEWSQLQYSALSGTVMTLSFNIQERFDQVS